MICTVMCFDDRWTTRRGRSAVPLTFLRRRKWRRALATRRLVEMSLPTGLRFVTVDSLMSLTRLSDLAADLLARVPHALALVRVGLAQLADVGGNLTDQLLVDTGDGEAGRGLHREGDALGGLDLDGVGVTERELELRALERDAVTDAVDLHLLFVTLGHTDDHVVHERARQAVERAVAALVVRALDLERAVLSLLQADRLSDRQRQGALRALHAHVLAGDVHVDPGGDNDRLLTDARHVYSPLPNVGEDFPAHACLVGLAVGHETARGRNDRHAEAAENSGQAGGLRVHAQARLRHAAEAGDAALAVRAVLQLDDEVLRDLALLVAVRGDVALALEDLGDVGLQLRVRHHDLVVVSRIRVAQTSEHVCDRVGHRHGDLVNLSRCGSPLRVQTWPPGRGQDGRVRAYSEVMVL